MFVVFGRHTGFVKGPDLVVVKDRVARGRDGWLFFFFFLLELRTGFVCKEKSGWRHLVDPSLSYTLVFTAGLIQDHFPTDGNAMKEIQIL